MAMRLLSKTYWNGTQIKFRWPVKNAQAMPVSVTAPGGVRLHGIFWQSTKNPNPKTVVIAAHPRVDFSEHHTFPALLDAGYGCLGANLRSLNNDMNCLHEQLVIDIATYISWLKDRGVEKVILLGNSGGGSLFSLYQDQAKKAPEARLSKAPCGQPVRLAGMDLPPGDAVIFIAAHTGQGLIINETIDPSVIDESDPTKTDPALDMYDPANGFKPAPQWSEYTPEFVRYYREGQLARVRRLDAHARQILADAADAARIHGSEGFSDLPHQTQRRILQREVSQRVMVVYRTLANLHYTDNRLDPSPRGYGSLISPRPDLMNFQNFGFARVVTPQGWLSTWSGLSSNANVLKTAPSITEPALVIQAGRDLDVFPNTHSKPIFEALNSTDKEYWDFPNALHYFEPDDGADTHDALHDLTGKLVPWIEQRFPL